MISYFGDYVLFGKIAEGGMGEVWRARHEATNRAVALKFIKADRLALPANLERFRLESEAAARLDHENIIRVFEVGELEGRHYFSMELADGGSLAEQIAEGRWHLTPENAVGQQEAIARLMLAVAGAIHHAHQRGVLHRDLKPSNILMDDAGTPHVTDFGLAKLLDSDPGVSQSGAILGTPDYMSPEQAGGGSRVVTIATDVHGLGTILYELLTGRRPFAADGAAAILHRVIYDEPRRPQAIRSFIDPDLEIVCLKCLEKNPSDRPGSAEEVAIRLDRWLNDLPIDWRPRPPWERVRKWVRRRPALAGLAATLVVTIAAGISTTAWNWRQYLAKLESEAALLDRLQLQQVDAAFRSSQTHEGLALLADLVRRRPEHRVAGKRLALEMLNRSWPVVRFTVAHSKPVTHAEFSPDGSLLATASGDATARLWYARTGRPSGEPLTHDGPVLTIQFNPAGTRLVTASVDNTARVYPLAPAGVSGPPVVLHHPAPVTSASFSPDGARILTVCADRTVRVWDAAAGRAIGFSMSHTAGVYTASFSPDGRRVAVALEDGNVWFWEGELKPAANLQLQSEVVHAVFSPDGSMLVTATLDRDIRLWDARTLTALSPPEKHKAWQAPRRLGAPLGLRLVSSDGDFAEWLKRHRRALQMVARPDFSPGGDSFVTAFSGSPPQLWTIGPSGLRNTFDPALVPEPAHIDLQQPAPVIRFSPDGRRVLSSDGGVVTLWSSDYRLLPLMEPLRHGGHVTSAAFSADGQQVVTGCLDSHAWIWDVRLGRSMPFFRTNGRSLTPTGAAESSLAGGNGKARVKTSVDGLREFQPMPNGIRVIDRRPGKGFGRLIPRLEPNEAFEISNDGRRLVLWHGRVVEAWTIDESGEYWRELPHEMNVGQVLVTPDGRRVITLTGDSTVAIWDADTGRVLGSPRNKVAGRILAFRLIDSDTLLVDAEGAVRVKRLWDVETGEFLFERTEPLSPLIDDPGDAIELPAGHRGSFAGLVEIAEEFAGIRLNDDGAFEPSMQREPGGRIHGPKIIVNLPADETGAMARWLVSDRSQRPASPGAAGTVMDELRARLEPGADFIGTGMETGPPGAAEPMGRLKRPVFEFVAEQVRLSSGALRAALQTVLAVTPRDSLAMALLGQPDSPVLLDADELAIRIGAARLSESGDRAGALGRIEAGLANPAVGRTYRLLALKSAILREQNQFEEAIAAISEALQTVAAANRRGTNPERLETARRRILILRGELWSSLRREAEARRDFVQADVSPRALQVPGNLLDLAPRYNTTLEERGFDLRVARPTGNNLARLPRGLVEVDGVQFDVRGLIQLSSRLLATNAPSLPAESGEITIGQRCARFHVLHGTVWPIPVGTVSARLDFSYADGKTITHPIVYGVDVEELVAKPGQPSSSLLALVPDWSAEMHGLITLTAGSGWLAAWMPEGSGWKQAWTGLDGMLHPAFSGLTRQAGSRLVHWQARVYKLTWINPRPDARLVSMNFRSQMTDSAPFLIAATVDPFP